MTPKITFVMPTKNREDRIIRSIESIIKQTVNEWELIVTDDHSDLEDKTEEIISSFNDQRIKYVRMPDNWSGGIPEARNFGNMFANSPIIAVADSDDIFMPRRAELTIKAFKMYNCDVVFGDYEIYNEIENKMIPLKYPIKKFDVSMLKERNYIPHSSSAYKRELAYLFPYNSFFRKAEDYDFFTRLIQTRKKFHYVNKILFRYIIHQDNSSRGKSLPEHDQLIKLNRGWLEADREITLTTIINR